jgi:hypothetical protein
MEIIKQDMEKFLLQYDLDDTEFYNANPSYPRKGCLMFVEANDEIGAFSKLVSHHENKNRYHVVSNIRSIKTI